jgi:hypothetical protein
MSHFSCVKEVQYIIVGQSLSLPPVSLPNPSIVPDGLIPHITSPLAFVAAMAERHPPPARAWNDCETAALLRAWAPMCQRRRQGAKSWYHASASPRRTWTPTAHYRRCFPHGPPDLRLGPSCSPSGTCILKAPYVFCPVPFEGHAMDLTEEMIPGMHQVWTFTSSFFLPSASWLCTQ